MKMKKLITLLIIALISITILKAQVVPLHVENGQLLNNQNQIVQLKGLSLGWHNWWGKYFNSNIVQQLKLNWNCTIIRAAIGVGQDNDVINNPDYAFKCLDSVVNECIKQNLYVIIDWHSHILKTQEAVEFFSRNAKKYGNYPNVIFEIFNEPIDDSWDDLKQYAQNVISEIRKYSQNIVLVGCPRWDQRIDLPLNSPIENVNNIMYTVHFYAGSHKDELRQLTEKALKQNLPIFISECGGMNADGDGPINETETDKWMQLINQYNLSYCFWSIADKNETCSMLKHNTPANQPINSKRIKPWGILTQKYIKQ